VVWVLSKDSWALFALGADKFIRGQSTQSLQALGVVVGQQKGLLVFVKLVGGLIVAVLDGGFRNHALYLAVSLRVRWFGQAMLYALFAADAVEAVPTWQKLVRLGRTLHPFVGQYRMHFIGQLVGHTP